MIRRAITVTAEAEVKVHRHSSQDLELYRALKAGRSVRVTEGAFSLQFLVRERRWGSVIATYTLESAIA